VVGCYECGYEPSCSGAMELVRMNTKSTEYQHYGSNMLYGVGVVLGFGAV
jgi:hypothetical protein